MWCTCSKKHKNNEKSRMEGFRQKFGFFLELAIEQVEWEGHRRCKK